MSDKIDDLKRIYHKHVKDGYTRRTGLFSIPEYPEYECCKRGMWSSALETILTTLRYLAPAALLTLFWGQQSFLFRILKQIDLAIKTIIYSSEEQKQSVLKWITETGPIRVDSLDTVWHHGWIVCGVLDATMPGACAGHPPTMLSLKHAQTIADHYLGVEPVFTRQELESEDSLSKHQEWKLAQYLERVREALTKIPVPVSKPCSQRTSPEVPQFTMDYTAKGSGLSAALINSKMFFKIYPTPQQSLEPSEIKVLIKGPKDQYGLAVIPPILGKAQALRQKLLDLEQKPQYTQNAVPLIQGTTYLRSYGKNDMKKTYHIPKSKYDIKIEAEVRPEYAKVGYTVDSEGRYEIFITSRGQNIAGSPFTVNASYNILDDLERESFCLEDGEEIDIVDVKTDRKVILRIVDFVTEKMLLKEDGQLEEISEEQAKLLMSTDKNEPKSFNQYINQDKLTEDGPSQSKEKTAKDDFKHFSYRLIKVLRFCKILNKSIKSKEDESNLLTQTLVDRCNKDIPDIINSTFNESFLDKHLITESLDYQLYKQEENSLESEYFDTTDKSLRGMQDESLKKVRSFSPNNPFLNDIIKENTSSSNISVDFPSLDDIPIKILVEEEEMKSESSNCNPFYDPEILKIERPKTPILKIITGEVKQRDSLYVDPSQDTFEDGKSNEFINPFYLHPHLKDIDETPVVDFIIGAPVSLPPIVKTSPEPTLGSIMITCKDERNCNSQIDNNERLFQCLPQSNVESHDFLNEDSISTNNNYDAEHIQNATLRRDLWDSAYVSIDDTSSSPDSNNNDNLSNDILNKNRLSPSEIHTEEDYNNMGPAEQEIWESCSELGSEKTKNYDNFRNMKLDLKRTVFTPIQEESDRSMSIDPKDLKATKSLLHIYDNEQVTVAFAELNDTFNEYLTNSEDNSIKLCHKESIIKKRTQNIDNGVDSASENKTDVMRRKSDELEGTISEVQLNATELYSASQNLDVKNKKVQKPFSIVSEKKRYWDQKIKEIEDVSKQQQHEKKRKVSTKLTKHNDSLTRRKGKQIIKNFLNAGENCHQVVNDTKNDISDFNLNPNNKLKSLNASDDQLDDKNAKSTVKENSILKEKKDLHFKQITPNSFKEKKQELTNTTSPNENEKYKTYTNKQNITDKGEDNLHKQDYTEEVFKAFETCPKRFFGTTRKHILNKIDSFLGKQNCTEEAPSFINVPKESGIVSNRVSLFHNISNVEELVWKKTRKQLSDTITEKDSHLWSEERTPTIELQKVNVSKLTNRESFDLKQKQNVDIENKKENQKNYNPPSHKEQKLNISNKTKVFQKSGTDVIEEHKKDENIIKIQADLKSQVNEAIRRRKIKDINIADTDKKTILTNKDHSHNLNKCCQIRTENLSNKRETPANPLRKYSFSRSDMDIFNKVNISVPNDDLDKHKSYDDLPKVNVKNFISIFETASKSAKSPIKPITRKMQGWMHRTCDHEQNYNDVEKKIETSNLINSLEVPQPPPRLKRAKSLSKEKLSNLETEQPTKQISESTTEDNYISLNDIDIEIIEKPLETPTESEGKHDISFDPTDYKSRFNKAKQYFKSLEELRDGRPELKREKACTTSIESLDNESNGQKTQSRHQSNSTTSTDNSENESNKLTKISEKFHVDDLFNDVVEGKLSRQGSLRGIPNKKAVLETFKSMENVSMPKISSYEISISQLSDFAKQNKIKNAQTYLSEYPYLPTTDPSKYHSRIDTKASGLVSLKELVDNKPRRNSVPDLRIVPSLTVDL